jgi:polar amino acid transport system substrate-binding protein
MNNFRELVFALGAGALAIAFSPAALAQTTVNTEIAPTGKLRVGLNASTTTLVTRAADGSVSGISVDLGKFIAEKLGMSYEPVIYASAAAYTESFGKGEWDISVAGRNAFATKVFDFSPDVILMEYVFVAAPGREFVDAGQVDRAGIKIGVPRNASADMFLSRTLQFAELVRVAGSPTAGIDLLRTGEVDVYATLTETAFVVAERLPGATIIPGAFTSVGFAIAIPKGRSSQAQSKLTQIVNEAKSAGIVQRAIANAGLKGIRVAPD